MLLCRGAIVSGALLCLGAIVCGRYCVRTLLCQVAIVFGRYYVWGTIVWWRLCGGACVGVLVWALVSGHLCLGACFGELLGGGFYCVRGAIVLGELLCCGRCCVG